MEGLGVCCLLGFGLLVSFGWMGFIFANKPKHFLSLGLGDPALGLALLIGLALAISSYESLPSVVFEDIAGFAPPEDVEFVNSFRHMPTDWDNSYLEMYASDSTIHRILAKGFTPILPTDYDAYGGTPNWWKPPAGPGVQVYVSNTDDPKFRDKTWRYFVSYRLLIYDSRSGDSSRRKVYLRYRRP